jgi:hypothetical protein
MCKIFLGPKRKGVAHVNPFVSLVRGFLFLVPHCLVMAVWNSSVLDRGAGIRFSPAFETVELPMLERVMSIPLFLLGENQSRIQRSMLYFEPERTYNI